MVKANHSILEIENSIVEALDAPLKALGVKVFPFPDDWKESGRPFIKNQVFVSFAGMDLDEPNSAGKARQCVPTYQTVSWTFNLLISAQKLQCGNPSTASMYEIIDAVRFNVCGIRPFEDLGPIWVSSVDYTGRENGCWLFTIVIQLEGKETCDENALIAPFAPPVMP